MRPYHHNDYYTLVKWWDGWEWEEPVPEMALPPTGVIEEGLAAGFVYLTNSQVGWITWIVTNPQASTRDRIPAIKDVVRELKKVAENNGVTILHSSLPTHQMGLVRLLEDEGFLRSPVPMINLIALSGAT